jgi:cytochrome P450
VLKLESTVVSDPVPDHVPDHLVYPFEQIFTKGFEVDPWAVFQQIAREAPPIFYSPLVGSTGRGTWYVTSNEDVRTVFQDYEHFTTVGYATPDMARRMLPLELDPPAHNKYRSLLTPLFAPKSIDRLETSIRETCNSILDGIVTRGQCDFPRDFARTLPGTVFIRLMGLPIDEREQFFDWEETFFHGETAEDRQAAGKAIEGALAQLVEERKTNPQDDLTSMLVHGHFADGSPIPHDDVMDMCWLLYIAGLDTVHAGLGHAFRYLGEHTDKRDELVSDPSLIPAAVEELLRWHSWVNPPRTVATDFELRGVKLKKGDCVVALAAIADRDPRQYDNPDDVDFQREHNIHWAFGGGAHRCLGSHLARREIGIAIEAWVTRVPDFHVPVEESMKLRYATLGMFSLPHLPLRWNPATAT